MLITVVIFVNRCYLATHQNQYSKSWFAICVNLLLCWPLSYNLIGFLPLKHSPTQANTCYKVVSRFEEILQHITYQKLLSIPRVIFFPSSYLAPVITTISSVYLHIRKYNAQIKPILQSCTISSAQFLSDIHINITQSINEKNGFLPFGSGF